MRPIVLGPNQPRTFYRGSGRLGRFRGLPLEPRPEDWVASTTARFGAAPAGLTSLPDGARLAEAIAASPDLWLGSAHVARYRATPGLLVKLLDAGQRLPVHVHPSRSFAAAHLGSRFGKTEAWIILEAAPNAEVHLGFARDVAAAELASWVSGQDTDALLGATNRVPISAGDVLLCPAGVPHSIGSDVLLVEVQEPTDFSVLLEFAPFGLSAADAMLGLPLDVALACVDTRTSDPESLRGGANPRSLLPPAADEFFRAERVGAGELDAGYSVLVATSGSGILAGSWGSLPVERGATVVVPFDAGPCSLTGDLTAVRCRPPA